MSEPGKFKLPTQERKSALEARKKAIRHARRYDSHIEKIDGRKYRVIRLPDGYGDAA